MSPFLIFSFDSKVLREREREREKCREVKEAIDFSGLVFNIA